MPPAASFRVDTLTHTSRVVLRAASASNVYERAHTADRGAHNGGASLGAPRSRGGGTQRTRNASAARGRGAMAGRPPPRPDGAGRPPPRPDRRRANAASPLVSGGRGGRGVGRRTASFANRRARAESPRVLGVCGASAASARANAASLLVMGRCLFWLSSSVRSMNRWPHLTRHAAASQELTREHETRVKNPCAMTDLVLATIAHLAAAQPPSLTFASGYI